MVTRALLAFSSKVKVKSVGSVGSGTAMTVSGGESRPKRAVVPTCSPPGPYWSTLTCSQRSSVLPKLTVALALDGSKPNVCETPPCGVTGVIV